MAEIEDQSESDRLAAVLAHHVPINTSHHVGRFANLSDSYTSVQCACQLPDEPFMSQETYTAHLHAALDAALLAVGTATAADEGPEAGHTFRISYESRGSYSVTGEEGGPRDAPEFYGTRHQIEVRAWNLRDALRKAARLPFGNLMGDDNQI